MKACKIAYIKSIRISGASESSLVDFISSTFASMASEACRHVMAFDASETNGDSVLASASSASMSSRYVLAAHASKSAKASEFSRE